MKPTKYDIADSNISGLGTDLEKQVKLKAAETEKAWKNVGTEVGTAVWRIEAFTVVPVNPKDYGVFYDGDSYIVLNTFKKPSEPKLYHSAHFWLGAETSQDEAGTAAYKTVELDDYLHGSAVQYRELQGSETRLFISYFPTFHTIKGGVASGFHKVGPKEYKPRFFHVQSVHKTLSVSQIDADVSKMNDGDVYILDKGLLIYQMNMSKSAGTERNKAAAFAREISADRSGSKVIVYDQGDEAKDFWENVKGDKSTIGPAKAETAPEPVTKVLARVSDATGSLTIKEVARGPTISRSLLTSDDVYVLNTGLGQVFAWIGKNASTQERKMGLQVAVNYVKEHNLGSIGVSRVVEGGEPSEFLQVFS